MRTPLISIVYFVMAAAAGAAGQYLYKSGADAAGGGLSSYLFNARLWAGLACYVSVTLLFIAAFKKGGSPTVLYPIYASTFIMGALLGWAIYGIPIRPVNLLGMGLLVAGMVLMGF